jgi:hypothetical protein
MKHRGWMKGPHLGADHESRRLRREKGPPTAYRNELGAELDSFRPPPGELPRAWRRRQKKLGY